MKKVFSILMVALMGLALCTAVSCTKDDGGSNGGNVNDVWVDLGLPSGTMWKSANEVNAADAEYDFYTYDEAVEAFGDALPTKEQWRELIDSCQWTWNGSGATVTGPNGHSIVLPAAGYRSCDGSMRNEEPRGNYWSSTPRPPEYAWGLYFGPINADIYPYTQCSGYFVRLVQN